MMPPGSPSPSESAHAFGADRACRGPKVLLNLPKIPDPTRIIDCTIDLGHHDERLVRKTDEDVETKPGRLRRRGFWLEGTSMGCAVAGAAVAVTAGIIASSIALIGLGLELVIGLFIAEIVIWQLRGSGDRETRAMRLIAIAFLASAAYLLAESIFHLAADTHPKHSAAGLAVAAAALLILPVLAAGKRRTGQALGNQPLIADATETALCAAAAAAAALGTGLDTWLEWWWAVPAAGLAIAALAVIEAIEVWQHHH